jgi:hypothetical protein
VLLLGVLDQFGVILYILAGELNNLLILSHICALEHLPSDAFIFLEQLNNVVAEKLIFLGDARN